MARPELKIWVDPDSWVDPDCSLVLRRCVGCQCVAWLASFPLLVYCTFCTDVRLLAHYTFLDNKLAHEHICEILGGPHDQTSLNKCASCDYVSPALKERRALQDEKWMLRRRRAKAKKADKKRISRLMEINFNKLVETEERLDPTLTDIERKRRYANIDY